MYLPACFLQRLTYIGKQGLLSLTGFFSVAMPGDPAILGGVPTTDLLNTVQ